MKHKKILIIFVLIIAIVLAYLLITGYTKINKYKLNVDNDYSNLVTVIEEKEVIVNKIIDELKVIDKNNTYIKELKKDISNLGESYKVENKTKYNKELDNKINNLEKEIKDNDTIKNLIKDYKKKNTKLDKKIINYNNSVTKYNNYISKFPNNIISFIFRFKKESTYN